jgi:hypothetical protein
MLHCKHPACGANQEQEQPLQGNVHWTSTQLIIDAQPPRVGIDKRQNGSTLNKKNAVGGPTGTSSVHETGPLDCVKLGGHTVPHHQ